MWDLGENGRKKKKQVLLQHKQVHSCSFNGIVAPTFLVVLFVLNMGAREADGEAYTSWQPSNTKGVS